MQSYPHKYAVSASAYPTNSVTVRADGLPDMATAPPKEFDGPGDLWSPESLLCAAVADCFVLSFRAIARASQYDWNEIACRVEGVLDRVDGVARFTGFSTRATLHINADADEAKGRMLMEKAERSCLVANSLVGSRTLAADVKRGQ